MEKPTFSIYKKKPTLEGAGVKLFRVFGNNEVPLFDPFLLLDHFGSKNPEDYLKGFPWHPHRGIETVTYMLTGEVEHADSLGNKGVIKSGDIQWMTAGSGIIHQEMPKKYPGVMQGFQLWINLPKGKKMIHPKYCGVSKQDIPIVKNDGIIIKVISGRITSEQKNEPEVIGPINDIAVDVKYYDVALSSGKNFTIFALKGYCTFIYVFEGTLTIKDKDIESGHCVLFTQGNSLEIRTKDNGRFLHISGKKINEPIAWGGPIVMNTQQELETAFRQLNEGTFIKK